MGKNWKKSVWFVTVRKTRTEDWKKHHKKKNIWTDFEEQKFITGETDQKIVHLLCPEVYI